MNWYYKTNNISDKRTKHSPSIDRFVCTGRLDRELGPRFGPGRSHFSAQLGVVRLEFCRALREANNDRVDRRSHDTHEDAAEHESHPKTDEECHGGSAFFDADALQQVWIGECGNQSNETGQDTDRKAHHEQDPVGKVVGDNDGPALLLEQLDYVSSCFDVTKAVQSNVNVRPFVEVFDNVSDAGKDAFDDAIQELQVLVLSCLASHHFECLDYGHQQRTETNGSKTVGRCPAKTVGNRLRAAAVGFVGYEPPRSDGSGAGNVNSVLDYFVRPIKRHEKKETDPTVAACVRLCHPRQPETDPHERQRHVQVGHNTKS
mmetsp:Transcript_6687/g.14524  ORF Transcript_6687/g.14524 Transcript_6687/m.14524 type:complete len:317 (-) Transcript_6687:827-1777(-)